MSWRALSTSGSSGIAGVDKTESGTVVKKKKKPPQRKANVTYAPSLCNWTRQWVVEESANLRNEAILASDTPGVMTL